MSDAIEAEQAREIDMLREKLCRRSRHLNAIMQEALRLGNTVPRALRKVLAACLEEEDRAIGLGLFRANNDETEEENEEDRASR